MKTQSTSPLQWILALLALALGAFLFAYYVNVLQDSVARGSRWKYVQQEQPAPVRSGTETRTASR